MRIAGGESGPVYSVDTYACLSGSVPCVLALGVVLADVDVWMLADAALSNAWSFDVHWGNRRIVVFSQDDRVMKN